jgi:putative ABC transport system ATP-binding protein
MIRFTNVCKTFGEGATEVQVLRDLTFAVPGSQFCTLMGPSGSGKSTVLHLVAGLTRLTSGEIEVGQRRLSQITEHDAALIRRRELGFIFQFFHLLPYLTAEENVALPLLLDGHSAASIEERTERVLRLVDLLDRRHHKPSELSGGQMQRVAIARALVVSPRLILADEPTGNLDSVASAGIMGLLRRSNEELNVTILMVTHDPVCASYGQRVVRMIDGTIVEDIDVSEAAAIDTPDTGTGQS